jgi:predicted dienelactone hydrolase
VNYREARQNVSNASCARTLDSWHPVAEDGPFPVVLLEHGSRVVPAIYTVLAEVLASSGFIVVATNHPPDSLISVFPDGHELKFTP